MSAVEMLARARCERHWRTPCDMSGCAEFSCEWRKGAAADLAALSAAGWVVVPREATVEQFEAARERDEGIILNENGTVPYSGYALIYRAMIAAAPQEDK